MTTYNDVFGNSTVPPSEYGYSSVTLATTTAFVWPYNSDGGDTTSKIMNVTASSAGLAFILPPANEVSTGEDLLIRNVGSETFIVQANDTTPVVTVAAGESKYLYLTDNSTAAGSWGVISFGVGTSSVDAATLVGYGIKAIAATLNQAHEVYVSATDVTIDATFRSKVVVFTGGAGTVTFPASTTVGNDFFFLLRNSGTGTLTLTPDGAETIDALSSMDMQPGESALLFSSGSSWYTVGYGRSVAFNFTQLVKDLSAYSGGTVTLTAAEASNKLLTFIGNPAAAVTVEVPAIVSVYYILNSLSTATSVTVEISGGTGVVVPQTQRIIAIADGTNVYSAQSVSASTTVSLLDGSAAAPSLNFASTTGTGLFKYSVNGLGITVNGSRVGFFDATGCQIDTAFNIVGNFSVATNKFAVTASNGNTTWASGAVLSAPSSVATFGTINKVTITAPATGSTLTIADGKTLTTSNTLTLAGVDGTTLTFQGTDTYVGRATTDTLTNKTLTAPVINGTVTTTGLTLPALTLGGTVTSNGQSFSGTIANLGTVTTADINGGTLDGVVIGGSSAAAATVTSLTASGNLTFTGTGNRITGNFSSTTFADRVAIQTSVTNDTTQVYVLPNGTSTTATIGVSNGSDTGVATTAIAGFLQANATDVRLGSGRFSASGTYLPMTFYTGGAERMRIDTSGNVKLSSANPFLFSDGPIGIQSGGTSSIKIYTAGGTERFAWDNTGNSLHTTAGGGLGYGTGAGGTVTQATSKSTTVTLNTPTGKIMMNNATLNANTTVQFLFNNSLLATTDVLHITQQGGNSGTANYLVWVYGQNAGNAYIAVRNISAGNLSEALVLNFAIIKGATS